MLKSDDKAVVAFGFANEWGDEVTSRTLVPEGFAVCGPAGGALHGPVGSESEHQQKKLPHGG